MALRRPVNRETLSARSSHPRDISRRQPLSFSFAALAARSRKAAAWFLCSFSLAVFERVGRGHVCGAELPLSGLLGFNVGERGSSGVEVACVSGVLSKL